MKRYERSTVTVLALVVAAGLFGYGRSHPGADGAMSEPAAASPASSKLAPLAFISGLWQTETGGDQLEEYWSPPAGDSMMGVFRWMKGGKVWMNELITIVDEGDQVVFRLKHFDAKMVGWEEKAECLTLKLVRSSANEVVFEESKPEQPLRITYRKAGEDSLQVSLERSRDGKTKTDEFTFRRAH